MKPVGNLVDAWESLSSNFASQSQRKAIATSRAEVGLVGKHAGLYGVLVLSSGVELLVGGLGGNLDELHGVLEPQTRAPGEKLDGELGGNLGELHGVLEPETEAPGGILGGKLDEPSGQGDHLGELYGVLESETGAPGGELGGKLVVLYGVLESVPAEGRAEILVLIDIREVGVHRGQLLRGLAQLVSNIELLDERCHN